MSALNGLRGLATAPWDAPDTSAADEARELAAAAHQAQCDADDAAASQPAAPVLSAAELRARARSYDRKALDAEAAGRLDDADRYRRRALLARRASVPASLAGIGGGR